jgi:acyl carrier protein
MVKQDVVEKVNQVFEESFEIERNMLGPEKKIFDDLGLDSLDIVDLVVALQQKFGVTIRDDERVRSIRTLEDIYNYIQKLGEEGALPTDA